MVIDELTKCGGIIHVEERVHDWCSGRSAPMICLSPYVKGEHAISRPRLQCLRGGYAVDMSLARFCRGLRHIRVPHDSPPSEIHHVHEPQPAQPSCLQP